MATATSGATIFYQVSTTDPAPNPTHNGSTPTGTTKVYTGLVSVVAGAEKFFSAIAYKSGMTDSTVTYYDANNQGGGQAPVRLTDDRAIDHGHDYDLQCLGRRLGHSGRVRQHRGACPRMSKVITVW